jgi:hypothetical protein
MIPSEVRDGLKTALQNIAGLRVYDTIPENPQPPAAIVGQLDMNFDINNARGLDLATVEVYLLVQRMDVRSGQNKLDGFLAGSGDNSVKAAIEADKTLGGVCNTLRVLSAESGQYESAGIMLLSYRYRISIWG